MQKEEVLEHLKPLTGVAVRTIEHQPTTRVIVTPDQVILRPGSGGHLVPLNEKGVKSLAGFIGMSQSMGKELSPELFGRVTTEILARRGRYSVLMAGGAIIDFAPPHPARNLPPERLVDVIEQVIPNADYHKVTTTDNYTATLEVVGEKREPVTRGDLVRAGALVTFSPVGTIQPLVQSFVMRLVCTNGAVDMQVLRDFHGGGDGDDVWQFFRKSIHDAYGSLGAIVNRYKEMIKDRIPAEQRALILEGLLRKAKIGGDLADTIRSRAIQQPPRNSYEMLNLITWASSHLLSEPAQVDRIRAIAAEFVSETAHHTYCPMCHSRN
jgi:hypothetical protein